MTPSDRQSLLAIARKMTTDEIVALILAHREAQLYIATLDDALTVQTERANRAEAALAAATDVNPTGIPKPINEIPTAARTTTRRREVKAA